MSSAPLINAGESAPANADLVLFFPEGSFIPRALRPEEFDGKKGSFAVWNGEDGREYFAGLGDSLKTTPDSFRFAAALTVRKAGSLGCKHLALDVSESSPEIIEAIAEGFLLGAYAFDEFRPKATDKGGVRKITLVGPKKGLKSIRSGISRGRTRADAVNFTREIGNLPGNRIDPPALAELSRNLAEERQLRCRVWTRAGLERDGFGGLLAVGGGSAKEPRLIRLDYDCGKKSAPTVAVVGKAITFDSGGLCLKPGDQMGEMKFDKMGGCAVLGILRAAADLKIPCNIVGLLAAAENMTGSAAYRPGDIIRTFDGTTVEIVNTDAEGRVVLADALGYAREKVKPDLVLDLATLTGACVVALGEERAGLFSEDEELSASLLSASSKTGESLWQLPLGEEFTESVQSKVADLRNLGSTRWGGASTAAAFLRHWTQGLPHAHIDLAGPAMAQKEAPHRTIGATGFGVRLVLRFLEDFSGKEG